LATSPAAAPRALRPVRTVDFAAGATTTAAGCAGTGDGSATANAAPPHIAADNNKAAQAPTAFTPMRTR
jgi:hypothetical protein